MKIMGDTVFIEKYQKDVFYRIKTDTIVQRDSIRFEHKIYVDKEIEVNKLHLWQVVLICLGAIFILLLFITIYKKIKGYFYGKN